MKRITRHFKTLKEAEDFQDALYEEYHKVRLVNFPAFSEDGEYVWEVANKPPAKD